MPTLQIPDHLDTNLEVAAAHQGRTKIEIVEQLLTAHIEEQFAAPETFTEVQIARFKKVADSLTVESASAQRKWKSSSRTSVPN